jgi:phosphomannomutase
MEKGDSNEPKFACVFVGRDTRLSSPSLAQAVINGIKSFDVEY